VADALAIPSRLRKIPEVEVKVEIEMEIEMEVDVKVKVETDVSLRLSRKGGKLRTQMQISRSLCLPVSTHLNSPQLTSSATFAAGLAWPARSQMRQIQV
jgi:hypothetical protein